MYVQMRFYSMLKIRHSKLNLELSTQLEGDVYA